MSQKSEQRLEQFIEHLEAQGDAAGMEDPLNSPAISTSKSEFCAPVDVAKLFALVMFLQAQQASQQSTLNDMQQQIDLQRLATTELVSSSQSDSSTIAKFEQIALNTAAAAEQLEAEIIGVRDTCNSLMEGISRDMAAFRAELEETRSCANFESKAEQQLSSHRITRQVQASDGLTKQEFHTMMEARDQALRDQMAQSLEAAQKVLSKSFLEELAKLLVEVVEDREASRDEALIIKLRLDAVAAMHNNAVPATSSSNPSNPGGDGAGISTQLMSMQEAIQELRVNMARGASADDVENNDRKHKTATERHLFEELAMVRKDITSCLDAANAAVRLGEHLANELKSEIQTRCSDMKALRVWAANQIETGPCPGRSLVTPRVNAEDPSLFEDAYYNYNSTPRLNLRHSADQNAIQENQSSVQDRARRHGIPNSLLIRSREFTELSLRKGSDAMQERPAILGSPLSQPSMTRVPSLTFGNTPCNSQHTRMPAEGSQNMSLGLDANGLHTPRNMLSSVTSLTRKQQHIPAGERYLANQRIASSLLTPPGGPPPSALNRNNSRPARGVESPRQTTVASPTTTYHSDHDVQRVGMGQAMDLQDFFRRQQGSPLREPPPMTTGRPLQRATVPAITPRGSSISLPSGILGSSRRAGAGPPAVRSFSPVKRQKSRS